MSRKESRSSVDGVHNITNGRSEDGYNLEYLIFSLLSFHHSTRFSEIWLFIFFPISLFVSLSMSLFVQYMRLSSVKMYSFYYYHFCCCYCFPCLIHHHHHLYIYFLPISLFITVIYFYFFSFSPLLFSS